MKKFWAILAVITLAVSPYAEAASEKEIIEKLENVCGRYTTLSSPFTHTRTLATGKEIKMEGQLSYSCPGRMAMVYSKPQGDLLIINSNMLYTSRADKKNRIDMSKVPAMRTLADILLDAVSGKVSAIVKATSGKLSCSETATHYEIVISAGEKGGRYSSVSLSYRKGDCILEKMVLSEGTGMKNCYLMTDPRHDTLIENTVYNIPLK